MIARPYTLAKKVLIEQGISRQKASVIAAQIARAISLDAYDNGCSVCGGIVTDCQSDSCMDGALGYP